MQPITFFIELKPHPQERIRFHIRGRGKRMKIFPYYPEKTREFQDTLREMVRIYMAENDIPEFPKGTPLSLELVFYLAKPKSTKREWPTVRPDLSNFIKSAEDGLQRSTKEDTPALVEDDSSIVRLVAEKRYIEGDMEPGIMVTIGEYCG